MNDRHRIKLTCEDGCGASLWLRLDGTRDAELHRDKLRRTLAAIAMADGWQAGRCPACVRWARGTEPAAATVEPCPIPAIGVQWSACLGSEECGCAECAQDRRDGR